MRTKERYLYEPDYAVPPGETLQETIDSLGMTQRELAARTGLTPQTVVRVIKGEQPITYGTANLFGIGHRGARPHVEQSRSPVPRTACKTGRARTDAGRFGLA